MHEADSSIYEDSRFTLLGPSKRSKAWDTRAIEDVVGAWERQGAEDRELGKRFLAAVAAGDWNQVDALNPEITKMQRRHRGEVFTESYAPTPTIESKIEGVEQPNPATFKPDLSPQRIRIPKNASAEDILQLQIEALQHLERATPSQSQRLGVAAARHLLERGFFVQP